MTTIIGAAKPATNVASTKNLLTGKASYFLPQRIVIRDTVNANKIKNENPILAMAGFKRLFIGFGEIALDVYKVANQLAGEISFTTLQQPGLMGPVDRPSISSAKLENLRISADTLWFIYQIDKYASPSKGFETYLHGVKILGLPAALSYKIPCVSTLPGYVSVDEKYLVISAQAKNLSTEKTTFDGFRKCIDTLNISDESLLSWKQEIQDAKFVIDSLRR